MRILISGVILFLIWTCLSGWFYVCQVKGLCSEITETNINAVAGPAVAENMASIDSTQMVMEPEPPPTVFYFGTDQSAITKDSTAIAIIQPYQTWIRKNPGSLVYVTGHTDARGTGTYNLSLGKRRAEAVRDYLTSQGIPAERIIVKSMGEELPIDNNSTSQGRAKNRRAEVSLNK